jgi:hypothetical protein
MYDLQIEDFQEHPVWEFCLDEEGLEGQDETTVRPSELCQLPANTLGAFLIAADVVFGNGTHAPGYLYSDEHDVISASPAAFINDKRVLFQIPGRLPDEKIDECKRRYYDALGMNIDSVFPVSFQSLIPVNGRPMKFVLDGFIFNGGPRKGQAVR